MLMRNLSCKRVIIVSCGALHAWLLILAAKRLILVAEQLILAVEQLISAVEQLILAVKQLIWAVEQLILAVEQLILAVKQLILAVKQLILAVKQLILAVKQLILAVEQLISAVGLVFEMLQLMWYGFGSQTWMMWAAGLLAAMSSITYPAISAYGIVTGMRGLCSGLGPAMFGVIFYLFHVDLSETPTERHTSAPSSGIGEASLYHALVVIFLEFFAWGLLTSPMIDGILSFLSAPLIGALSDVWGRKFFLLVTVFFTCLPIPFMKINTWWYFALISMSGVFAVTFSIVFAYVADVTDKDERSYAYGLVSATFAASLVTSPALGAYLGSVHSDDLVVGVATAIAVLDVFFILVAVPESLPEKLRISSSWSAANISWENADPFSVSGSLRQRSY
ncbi:hypothetical protein HAZT_HAZT004811 [Hyalella azteca]|uniref:Major facilitator superfamily (MFS) profile domain-containing protein n=1 Tax=Hyalella azteca TaxID=294128 RepID=A0A6A0GY38_HYAAZ|nr:hypothetical protein HAZT_HAZT004811 [Hyalella azteca]